MRSPLAKTEQSLIGKEAPGFRELPAVTYCGTGYRASIASSILEREGILVNNIPGSMSAWLNAGVPEEAGQ